MALCVGHFTRTSKSRNCSSSRLRDSLRSYSWWRMLLSVLILRLAIWSRERLFQVHKKEMKPTLWSEKRQTPTSLSVYPKMERARSKFLTTTLPKRSTRLSSSHLSTRKQAQSLDTGSILLHSAVTASGPWTLEPRTGLLMSRPSMRHSMLPQTLSRFYQLLSDRMANSFTSTLTQTCSVLSQVK